MNEEYRNDYISEARAITLVDENTEVTYVNTYHHNFRRIQQHLNAILSGVKGCEGELFDKIRESANTALCYIPLEHDK